MKNYDIKKVEKKWQDFWYSNSSFTAVDFSEKTKYYALIEFPYPSGTGMHVGHIKAFTSLDVVARKKRMEGYNVLFPIGFDAFGLPTENYAIKTGIHPREVTNRNIKIFTNQLKRAGFSFDFSRVVDTTQADYYKWTQWIFLKLFEKGLAYKAHSYVNYCPSCQVVLANEDSQGGQCDRCGSEVIQKEKDVWFLKITAYSESLLEGLEHVDYLPRIKMEQINWIGKSEGVEVKFKIKENNEDLLIFTTRADTLFGVTFMVIAPEHPLIERLKDKIENYSELQEYRNLAAHKTEFERLQMNKGKTGVRIIGLNAINPVNGKVIPIFVADYVMLAYGTGAIMAVPAHDSRDFSFAKEHDCPIIEVIKGGDINKEAYTDIEEGILCNSDFLNGLGVKEAQVKITEYLVSRGIGEKMINYKMKDWAFNRQRYWGEPIPIIKCPHCGYVADNNLPLKLPEMEHFQPGTDGESPLASLKDWVRVKCPICNQMAERETDTMPQWAGSSWYFLRYCDPHNNKELASYDKMKYWLPVDWYNGGMEHVTRHMIYSRFWNQFLYDEGIVPVKEPYARRTAVGLILGEDGEKMSKSRGNIVDPIDIINEYGADTLRTYILFLGEYEQPSPWSEAGIKGCKRFLDRIYRFLEKVDFQAKSYSKELEGPINKTIKDVGSDIENVKFNTAISKLMTLSNEYAKYPKLSKKDLETFIALLNPFAPHLCEEINEQLGNNYSMVNTKWPNYDESKTIDNTVIIAVQVNGKLRGTFPIAKDSDKKALEEKALELESIKQHITGKTIRKIIVVPNKIVNIVVN
ncbi:leucine--tRNA ligase [bacterium]|jgi:leucyl-tRNA synthetase|nr:leucine--tRNA ligase [bacterium]